MNGREGCRVAKAFAAAMGKSCVMSIYSLCTPVSVYMLLFNIHSVDVLLAHVILAHAQRPHAAMRVSQLLQKCAPVLLVVFVYNDAGFLVPVCHGDGAATQDRDARYRGLGEHGGEDRGADEPGCAGEDEMHGVCMCLFVSGMGVVIPRLVNRQEGERAVDTR